MRQADHHDPLFAALAEQLKLPLLQITRLSEMGGEPALSRISLISDYALMLVDAFSLAHSQMQGKLLLEPITTTAILYDVAQSLEPFARQAQFEIEVDKQGREIPIMAHRDSLETMLTLLGASLLEASDDTDTSRRLVLGTHRTDKGTVVGAFSGHTPVTQKVIEMTRRLHGRAAHGVPVLRQAGGAGLAIADRLGEQMSAPLKSYRHKSLIGIGSLLTSSHQLQLVA